ADSLDALDRNRPVVAYCASGYRSQIAGSVLAEAGFGDVSDLLGGYSAWEGAGLPVARGANVASGATEQVTARAASALVDGGALLLDVREPDEWREGHAPQAVLMP